jgi:hypothetical protein
MIEVFDLPSPKGDPLMHYAEQIEVKIWLLERLL